MINELTYTSFVERYRDKSYLGSGGFAKVYKVYDYANKKYVALKVADVRAEFDKFTLQNEVKLVNQLSVHPNVIRYEACYRFNTGIAGDMDFAVLPYYELGNLEQFLNNSQPSFAVKHQIVKGVLEGIRFLHHENCIHRDLKAQNILIEKAGDKIIAKIADFGLSRYVKSNDLAVSNSSIGLTFEYASPEQIKNHKIYKNVDLWAVGVLIYKVITGKSPFKKEGVSTKNDVHAQLEISNKIVNRILPESFHSIPPPYKAIIDRCLVVDPHQRAQSADELIQILNTGLNTPGGGKAETSYQPSPEEKTTIIPPVQQPSYKHQTQRPEEKTQIIKRDTQPARPAVEPPQEVFKYIPPADSNLDPYETPRQNVTQIVNPSQYKEPAPEQPVRRKKKKPAIKMSAPSEKISKAWIYIPLYVVFVGLVCGGLYFFMTSANKPSVPKEMPATSASTVPADFLQCFEQGRKALGGTFAIIPTEEFMPTFEQMDKSCYNKICNTLNAIAAGDNSVGMFYLKVDKGDACFEPLYNKSLAYHIKQLKSLPLLALFYDSGQYRLDDRQQARLDGFISLYKRSADKYGLLIIGRASKKGNVKSNKSLSERRGKAIIDYIEQKATEELTMHFAYFGADPPQLNQDIAEQCGIQEDEYRNISYGGGKDADYSLRLNQSVLLLIYPKTEDPFGLEKK